MKFIVRILFAGALSGFTLSACTDVEKQANALLGEARTAYQEHRYADAKLLIDSIKSAYPKAYDTRHRGIELMQEVELAEQEQTLAYLDSVRTAKAQEVDALKTQLAFEKDAEYERIGHYLHPSQVIEKNLHRSFLRFRVDEKGVLKMTSIYCGARNIHHIAVKVIAPDGSFAETPASKDSYETTDGAEKIEKADYNMGEDGNVMSFIYLNRDKALRVEYKGERPYSTNLTAADRKALASLYEFARVLSSLTEVQENIDEAQLKKEFVTRKISERTPKE